MAGDWIKVRVNLPDDPAVFRMASVHGVSTEQIVGHLIRVWAWATDQLESGHARNVTLSQLDAVARVTGFGQSMVEVGWLVVQPDGLMFPRWERHLSQGAKQRVLATERKRRERVEKSQECHDASVTKTRLQKRRAIDDDEEVSNFSDEQMQQRIACLRHRPDWLPPGKPWVSEPMARNLARNPRLTSAILEAAAKVAREGRNTLRNPCGCFIAEIQKALSTKEAA
jgi:hypothetical protein